MLDAMVQRSSKAFSLKLRRRLGWYSPPPPPPKSSSSSQAQQQQQVDDEKTLKDEEEEEALLFPAEGVAAALNGLPVDETLAPVLVHAQYCQTLAAAVGDDAKTLLDARLVATEETKIDETTALILWQDVVERLAPSFA